MLFKKLGSELIKNKVLKASVKPELIGRKIVKSYYIKNVATLSLDSLKCIGCKECLEVCPHGVFKMNDRKAEIYNKNLCMECGACMKNCPSEAIKVEVGVGCAAALLFAAINKTAPSCGCSEKSKKTSSCG